VHVWDVLLSPVESRPPPEGGPEGDEKRNRLRTSFYEDTDDAVRSPEARFRSGREDGGPCGRSTRLDGRRTGDARGLFWLYSFVPGAMRDGLWRTDAGVPIGDLE